MGDPRNMSIEISLFESIWPFRRQNQWKWGFHWASHMLTYQQDSRKYGGITGITEKGSNTCTPKKAGSPALLSFERTCTNLRHCAARSSHHQHPPVRTCGKHWKTQRFVVIRTAFPAFPMGFPWCNCQATPWPRPAGLQPAESHRGKLGVGSGGWKFYGFSTMVAAFCSAKIRICQDPNDQMTKWRWSLMTPWQLRHKIISVGNQYPDPRWDWKKIAFETT